MTTPARDASLGQCPVAFVLDLVGDRWSLLILRDLLFKQKCRYGELLDSPEGISTNILAARLKMLELNGLLVKHGARKRVTYALTPKALDLVPMMLEMVLFSAKHDPQPNAPDSGIVGAPHHLLERWPRQRKSVLTEVAKNLDDGTGEHSVATDT